MPTPRAYEAIANKARRGMAGFAVIAVVFLLFGLVVDSHPLGQLLRSLAAMCWGLACAIYWFRPIHGFGPEATKTQGKLSPAGTVISWPAALGLDLWFGGALYFATRALTLVAVDAG